MLIWKEKKRMQPIEALQKRIEQSELGREWAKDPLMSRDVWEFTALGYSEEECAINNRRKLYFEKFSLSWLKQLTKITTRYGALKKDSLGTIRERVTYLRQLDDFLASKAVTIPELINNALLQEFIFQGNKVARRKIIKYVVNVWSEENWLKLSFTCPKYKEKKPKLVTIPEEVLLQIYKNFDLLPPPLERLFRLQFALGCRITELLKIPRRCLKKEGEKWFLLRWIEKRKHWRFYQIHPLVAELVLEQQKFLGTELCQNTNFDKLFCRLSTAICDGVEPGGRFQAQPIYIPEPASNKVVQHWLRAFSEQADLKDKYGNRFNLQSHMFRRTKANIMAYCEAEDEYIASILGHASLDMLPHYRQHSLERLEKEADTKGYVDMYARITTFKPRKRRYEKLSEILETKVTTQLGGCHRPLMLGDCQYRYACLSCIHHRVTLEDKPKIESDIKSLKEDLKQAQAARQERRITEIKRLLEVRTKYGMEAAQLYADHKSSTTTFQHYAPPTREQIAEVDLPFQKLLLNPDNKFLPWQSLPESLLKNPKAHELDLEIAPRLVVYGHCALDPKTPCPVNLFPKCYGCSSFRPSTGKLPLYERQYQGEQQRLTEAEKVGAELAQEEAKATMTAMDKWLPELRRLANG